MNPLGNYLATIFGVPYHTVPGTRVFTVYEREYDGLVRVEVSHDVLCRLMMNDHDVPSPKFINLTTCVTVVSPQGAVIE